MRRSFGYSPANGNEPQVHSMQGLLDSCSYCLTFIHSEEEKRFLSLQPAVSVCACLCVCVCVCVCSADLYHWLHMRAKSCSHSCPCSPAGQLHCSQPLAVDPLALTSNKSLWKRTRVPRGHLYSGHESVPSSASSVRYIPP